MMGAWLTNAPLPDTLLPVNIAVPMFNSSMPINF
jgi:hypothetical protein